MSLMQSCLFVVVEIVVSVDIRVCLQQFRLHRTPDYNESSVSVLQCSSKQISTKLINLHNDENILLVIVRARSH